MTNRFKVLDLTDRVPDELLMEVHDIVQEAVIKTILKKKKAITNNRKEEKLKAKEKRKDTLI